jgi:hypothetical protein
MRTLLIFLACFIAAPFLHGQNIVPNPGFAEYWHCPTTGENEMDSCKYWSGLYKWYAGDYFNACAGTVPNHQYGYQYSYDNAQVGLHYEHHGAKNYICTSIPALEIGATYKVTLVVSLADSVREATKELGIVFYNNLPDSIEYQADVMWTHIPQIDYYSYGYITDKVNWTHLSSTFVADSGYTNLMIGGYLHDTSGTCFVDSFYYGFCYYLLDSVSVEKIASAGVTQLGADQVRAYPNPVNDKLNISGTHGANTNIRIYNMLGQLVQTEAWRYGQLNLDVSFLAAGMYYAVLDGGKGGTTVKFVKQ